MVGMYKPPTANNGYCKGVCAGKEPTKFSNCTSIKEVEREEPVFVELESGGILAARDFRADFVSDGKYLKVTLTLVNVSDKTMETKVAYWGASGYSDWEAMTAASIYRTGTGIGMEDPGDPQQFSLACKKAPGRMIYLPCGLDFLTKDRIINLTIPAQTI